MRTSNRSSGGALLMVMWVSAALAAIGFSLASTVRGEAERTRTAVDDLRSYYLAVGGVQRGMVELLWSALHPGQRALPRGATTVDYQFPSGIVRLDILPEAGKLNVNFAPAVDLVRLMIVLGAPEDQAREIAGGIAHWRGGGAPAGLYDGFYQAPGPSFRGPRASFPENEELLLVKGVTPDLFYRTYVPGETGHGRAPRASFKEIEELLLVKGVTPDLFYGTYVPVETGDGPARGMRLVRRGGMADCLSVYGSKAQVDANTAAPAVLAAIGLSRYAVNALLERRSRAPLTEGELAAFMG